MRLTGIDRATVACGMGKAKLDLVKCAGPGVVPDGAAHNRGLLGLVKGTRA